MRIAAGLLGLTLLGCQASSPTPTLASKPEPTRLIALATPEARQPMTHLNPRRQRLQVGATPLSLRKPALRVAARTVPAPTVMHQKQPRIPTESWPPRASLKRIQESQARVDSFLAQEQQRLRQNQLFLNNRPLPGEGLTPDMQRIAYPQVTVPAEGSFPP